MKYYVISIHPEGDTIANQFNDIQKAINWLDSIGGWIDGKRFIAVPLVRRVEYSEPTTFEETNEILHR